MYGSFGCIGNSDIVGVGKNHSEPDTDHGLSTDFMPNYTALCAHQHHIVIDSLVLSIKQNMRIKRKLVRELTAVIILP